MTFGAGPFSRGPFSDPFGLGGAAPQLALPTSDIAAGAWVSSLGGALYLAINESTPSDAEYDYTTATSTMTVALAALTDPVSSTGHIVHYRVKVTSGTLGVSLMQGATTIASWSHTIADAGSVTQFDQTLSGGQADSITDYTALSLKFVTT